MDPDKIQLLKDEIEQKLPEVLSNLGEVYKKYGISETQSTTIVELKLAPTKLQSGDAPQDLEEQTLSLAVAAQEDLPLHYEWTKKVSKGVAEQKKQSLERIVESLTNSLDADELEHTAQLIAQAVNLPDVSEADREFARVLAGREFDEHERVQLEFWALLENFAYRRQLLAGALSAPQVAKLLGTSRQTPHDRVQAGTLLGVMDKGALKFPAWQFDSLGPDGVIDGLKEVLKALHMSDFAKLSWLMRPLPNLEGLTPVEVLKQGGIDKVIAEANALGVS